MSSEHATERLEGRGASFSSFVFFKMVIQVPWLHKAEKCKIVAQNNVPLNVLVLIMCVLSHTHTHTHTHTSTFSESLVLCEVVTFSKA